MPVSPLVRAALTVSQLERSRDFYVGVLGLTEVFLDSTVEGGNMHALMGAPASTKTRICILKTPGTPAYGMVGLFEMTDPQPRPLDFGAQGSWVGELCLVFYCPDLDAVMGHCLRLGLVVISPPAGAGTARPRQAARDDLSRPRRREDQPDRMGPGARRGGRAAGALVGRGAAPPR